MSHPLQVGKGAWCARGLQAKAGQAGGVQHLACLAVMPVVVALTLLPAMLCARHCADPQPTALSLLLPLPLQLAFTPQRAVRPSYGTSGRTIKVKANW